MSTAFDEEDDDYFSEVDPEAELTGLEPRFVKIDGAMDERGNFVDHNLLTMMKTDQLIALYIKCRNQYATDTKGYKARKERIKTFQGMISMALRDRGDQNGVDSFATASGTAYRNKKEKFPIENWEDLVSYIKKTDNFQVLQKRVSPNAVKEIRETDGQRPPGIGLIEEEEFAVRAPSKRK